MIYAIVGVYTKGRRRNGGRWDDNSGGGARERRSWRVRGLGREGSGGNAGGRESGTGSVYDRGTGKSVKDADARRQEGTSNDIIVRLSRSPRWSSRLDHRRPFLFLAFTRTRRRCIALIPAANTRTMHHLQSQIHPGRPVLSNPASTCASTTTMAETKLEGTTWAWRRLSSECFASGIEDMIKQAVSRMANARPLATHARDDRHGDSPFTIDVVYPRANFCLCIVDGNKTISYFDLASVCPPFSALCESGPSNAGTSYRSVQQTFVPTHNSDGVSLEGTIWWEMERRWIDESAGVQAGTGRIAMIACPLWTLLSMPFSITSTLYTPLLDPRQHSVSIPDSPSYRLDRNSSPCVANFAWAGHSLSCHKTRCCSHGRTRNDEGGRRTQEGKSGTGDEWLKRVILWEEVVRKQLVPIRKDRTSEHRSNRQSSYKEDQDGLLHEHAVRRRYLSRHNGQAIMSSWVVPINALRAKTGPVQEEKCACGGGAAADEKVAGGELLRERLEGPQAQVA
ncbi:hypothetical protein K488DRAFT_74850 [Vararia minispora EC-137]|uniref:Uncharacterized protein n=1 Tax=Vararia minispora EC-137 TaxID=1314806 RepID=A0ACB8Q5N4_9AGAM|nr:hypothetical protein K488DRAFT_74850 [Vararia minispora EC-137]